MKQKKCKPEIKCTQWASNSQFAKNIICKCILTTTPSSSILDKSSNHLIATYRLFEYFWITNFSSTYDTRAVFGSGVICGTDAGRIWLMQAKLGLGTASSPNTAWPGRVWSNSLSRHTLTPLFGQGKCWEGRHLMIMTQSEPNHEAGGARPGYGPMSKGTCVSVCNQ
jgi:hypothetical protein